MADCSAAHGSARWWRERQAWRRRLAPQAKNRWSLTGPPLLCDRDPNNDALHPIGAPVVAAAVVVAVVVVVVVDDEDAGGGGGSGTVVRVHASAYVMEQGPPSPSTKSASGNVGSRRYRQAAYRRTV